MATSSTGPGRSLTRAARISPTACTACPSGSIIGTFEWSDAAWQPPPLASGVVYELHIGTFSEAGTFAGAIAKLPHLVALGVTHVELMPVAEFSGDRGWGYDGVDLFAPHHAYGRPDDLKRLVDACHASGLAVILDVVYNHFGPAGNYLSQFGPYFTHRYNTPWGDAVNLDDAGQRRGAALLLRQRGDVAARLPFRRSSSRCRACPDRYFGAPFSGAAG